MTAGLRMALLPAGTGWLMIEDRPVLAADEKVTVMVKPDSPEFMVSSVNTMKPLLLDAYGRSYNFASHFFK